MAIIPFQVDVGMSRWPVANFVLIAGIIGTQVFLVYTIASPELLEPLILRGWSVTNMVGHMFVHGGIMHLLGNMIFLWTFGNAVCAKVGNFVYIPLFLALGLCAASVHNFLDAAPAIGASGAINGIVGMYLVYYPRNNVTCLYWIFFRIGTFYLSGFWIILLFFAFDAWGALSGGGGVAYWAHLGGFAAGVLTATVSLLTGIVEMTDGEESLLRMLGLAE